MTTLSFTDSHGSRHYLPVLLAHVVLATLADPNDKLTFRLTVQYLASNAPLVFDFVGTVGRERRNTIGQTYIDFMIKRRVPGDGESVVVTID